MALNCGFPWSTCRMTGACAGSSWRSALPGGSRTWCLCGRSTGRRARRISRVRGGRRPRGITWASNRGWNDLLTELTQVKPLSLLSREITDGDRSAGQLPFWAAVAGFGLCWNLGSSVIVTDLGGWCSARASTEHRHACGSTDGPCRGGSRRAGAIPAGRRVRGRGGGRVGVPEEPDGVGLLAGHGALVCVRASRLVPVPGRGGRLVGPGVAGRGPRLRALAVPDPEDA